MARRTATTPCHSQSLPSQTTRKQPRSCLTAGLSRRRLGLPTVVLVLCWIFVKRTIFLHVPLMDNNEYRAIRTTQDAATWLNSMGNEDTSRKRLKLDWTNLELKSHMAKRIKQHLSNCSLPLGKGRMRNRFGLGSDLHVWSQVLCNAMDENVRLFSPLSWQWRDETVCGSSNTTTTITEGSLDCYFPEAEPTCPLDDSHLRLEKEDSIHVISSPYGSKCPSILGDTATEAQVGDFRAAAMEYLFHRVAPSVVEEAERQLNLVFSGETSVPDNLITVQIRWGDKQKEMKLLSIQDYIRAVQQILDERADSPTVPVHIYLATEDPKAVDAFRKEAPENWRTYVDQYFHDMLPLRAKEDVYNQGVITAYATKGHAGLVALGSLLVAMEANDFVLTTKSNWSRVMNELRKNVIDPRCGGCTRVIDLKYGEW